MQIEVSTRLVFYDEETRQKSQIMVIKRDKENEVEQQRERFVRVLCLVSVEITRA